MIVKISDGLIKKALPKKGEIVPVVKGRPNLPQIDLTMVEFKCVASHIGDTRPYIEWEKLVAFMEKQLQKGLLTLGPREWLAISHDPKVNDWLKQEPRDSPWKFGIGSIGFPDGLINIPGCNPSYKFGIWLEESAKWHEGEVHAEKMDKHPVWRRTMRMPVYLLDGNKFT